MHSIIILTKNVVDFGGDGIWMPHQKCHLCPSPGRSEFSLPVLTESRWVNHCHAGRSSQTMPVTVYSISGPSTSNHPQILASKHLGLQGPRWLSLCKSSVMYKKSTPQMASRFQFCWYLLRSCLTHTAHLSKSKPYNRSVSCVVVAVIKSFINIRRPDQRRCFLRALNG